MTEKLQDESVAAPHGRDDDGNPLAPHGYLRDGVTPRKGNRGAKPGQRRGAAAGRRRSTGASVRIGSRTDKQRKETLINLADMLIVTPTAALAASPQIAGRIGPKQATALAGDAVLVSHYMPGVADGLIVLSQSKPGVLSWLDNVEQKAPYLMLAMVGLNLAKALVENHLSPNEELAHSGRLMLQMKVQQMAAQIENEAREMGIDTSMPAPADHEPTVRLDQETAA